MNKATNFIFTGPLVDICFHFFVHFLPSFFFTFACLGRWACLEDDLESFLWTCEVSIQTHCLRTTQTANGRHRLSCSRGRVFSEAEHSGAHQHLHGLSPLGPTVILPDFPRTGSRAGAQSSVIGSRCLFESHQLCGWKDEE